MKKNLKRPSPPSRIAALILVVCLLSVELSGCAALRKKFTRKKKKKKEASFVYNVQDYEKPPNIDLYKKHFAFWKTWHKELVNKLGMNKMRDLRAFTESVGELESLKKLLAAEKTELLQGYIDQLEGHYNKYKSEDFTETRSRQMRKELNRLLLRIDKAYRFSRVKDDIKTK